MSVFKVKSKKWYGWFWPPERRKIKLMQALVDYKEKDIVALANEHILDEFLYGIKPTYTAPKPLERKSL